MNNSGKFDKQALAFIESTGRTGIIAALDIMPKTSKVFFLKKVSIGRGIITVVFSGGVAAAISAQVEAKNLVSNIGQLLATNVIPRPHERIYELLNQKSGKDVNISHLGSQLAIGIVETMGFVGMIEAADAGIKAAKVIIPGWVTVGGGLTTVFYRGEVSAVKSAVTAGTSAASKVTEVISTHVIPQPHLGTEQVAPVGKVDGEYRFPEPDLEAALGVLETRGITGLIEGIDAGLKAAEIVVQGWEKIGRGLVSTIFRGKIADVKTAMHAAIEGAQKTGKFVSSHIIPRPHSELEKGR